MEFKSTIEDMLHQRIFAAYKIIRNPGNLWKSANQ